MTLCERRALAVHDDPRGRLWEALHEDDLGKSRFGTLYVVAVRPGFTRGNHVHQRKSELFSVVSGRVKLQLWRSASSGAVESESILLDGARPEVVKVPPGVCHRFENASGAEAIVLAYSDEPFDPRDPDTAPPPVSV